MASSGLSPSPIFKKPAACTNVASPKPGHFLQLLAAFERAVRRAMVVQPPGRQLIQTRNVPQQRRAGRVQIDADIVDARLDHGVERCPQVLGLDVVLIHADADIGRIDLHQLAERILQPPADGNRAAERGVVSREIPRGQVGWSNRRWPRPR